MATSFPAKMLNKSRPQALKAQGMEEYFKTLELILSDLQDFINGSSGSVDQANIGLIISRMDELRGLLLDDSPILTADTTSFTADNTYLDASIY